MSGERESHLFSPGLRRDRHRHVRLRLPGTDNVAGFVGDGEAPDVLRLVRRPRRHSHGAPGLAARRPPPAGAPGAVRRVAGVVARNGARPVTPYPGAVHEPDQAVTAPAAPDQVRWGLGDAAVGWLLGLVGGALVGGLVLAATGADDFDDVSLGWVAVAQLAQYAIIWIFYLPLQLLTDISSSDITEPAREMTDRADDPLGVILLVVILGLGAPIVEEIFYRGLLQRSLVRRIGQPLGVGVSALVFAASHLQPLQFPALLMFGIVLGVLAERYGRLGPAIAAHTVFNLTAVVSLLVLGS